jgi:CheY-like chemotaxis protein
MALRSGARLRRADSIQSAKRHLRVYMPSVIIVDVGLPDGSGLDLIRELSNTRPRVAALIGTSGDELHHTATLKAGADVFISKPYESLASFQQTLLNLFPGSEPLGLRLVSNDMVHPDPAALRDDLYHAKSLIEHEPNKPMCDYLRQFLTGVAKSVGDTHLERAAQNEPIEDLGVIIDQKIREVRIF